MMAIEKTSFVQSITFKFGAAIFVAALVCLLVWMYPALYGASPTVAVSNEASRIVGATGTAQPTGEKTPAVIPASAIAASSATLDTTYRPKSPRAYRQFLGAVDSNGDVDRRVAGWWLFAKSEAESRWLDEYGFPTPSEEARLNKSTDAELAVLVANGDLNAKAHQATRFAKAAFASGNTTLANQALGSLTQALGRGGGPYQAFTVYRAHSEMLSEYDWLPEGQKTPEQRAILDKYDYAAQLALAYGSAFGDQAMLALYHTSHSREIAGLPKMKEYSALQFADTMAMYARRRLELGLPPLTLSPRPAAPETAAQGAKGIILERY